jgi:hypothetical protein
MLGPARRLLHRPALIHRPCIVVRGGVSERPKEHASKACEVQASQGSNPCATADSQPSVSWACMRLPRALGSPTPSAGRIASCSFRCSFARVVNCCGRRPPQHIGQPPRGVREAPARRAAICTKPCPRRRAMRVSVGTWSATTWLGRARCDRAWFEAAASLRRGDDLPLELPLDSWRVSLCRGRLVGGDLLVLRRGYQRRRAVSSSVL